MSLISKFVNEGIIKPLPICKTFSSAEVTEAFRFMRDGKHIGKIVVSDSSREAVKVPVCFDGLLAPEKKEEKKRKKKGKRERRAMLIA